MGTRAFVSHSVSSAVPSAAQMLGGLRSMSSHKTTVRAIHIAKASENSICLQSGVTSPPARPPDRLEALPLETLVEEVRRAWRPLLNARVQYRRRGRLHEATSVADHPLAVVPKAASLHRSRRG
mmetsp:Transcript_15118/g.39022  ORF Transcript_15118/g.39022 Transcript_15118/m.39022 type:complete len:124 (-) Transcript_15118:1140-1511(-)